MSLYGKKWLIDGVAAAMIRRTDSNGGYTVLFEREYADLQQIEGINWAQPVVKSTGAGENAVRLPEGYGFDLVNIRYAHSTKTWEAELKVAAQYLGDVTGYQEEIAALQANAAESAAAIADLESALAEADELAIALYEAQQAAGEPADETAEETADETAGEVQE